MNRQQRRALKARAFLGDRTSPDKAMPVETHAEYLRRKANPDIGIPMGTVPWSDIFRSKHRRTPA